MESKTANASLKYLMTAAFMMIFIGYTSILKAAVFFQDQTNQVNFTQYSGEVIDSQSKDPLVFASLSLDGTNISTVTNTEGKFSLKVPKDIVDGNLTVSFLGYKTTVIALNLLKEDKNRITLEVLVTELPEVSLTAPKDAEGLVRETLKRKGENYFNESTVMTAFYRETIKKRRTNVSLSEAVVNIYKMPYSSDRKDAMELYKARKSTDYNRLDTLALKLQGGPFNTLYVDVMKYPEYIFTDETISDYIFSFENSTRIDGHLIYVVNFKQRSDIEDPLYKGKLFIDAEKKILTSAVFSLNITDKDKAAALFVRKKPADVRVWPTDVAYRVDYREKNGKWYYGYSNVLLEFKVDWKHRFFNSTYTLTSEMAVTDWEKNLTQDKLTNREKIKTSMILSDEASGFSDPDFWGAYNIIEPEKSIQSAIKKIQRQLEKSKSPDEKADAKSGTLLISAPN
ncbi:MAG: carboxypeptidase-like regulatory domain-containing protein [Flavobacteriaceae bacterium]|nr:carboxypeptidase-like regulatory domain-containing protein [Flavobacteriaceae bacterium]